MGLHFSSTWTVVVEQEAGGRYSVGNAISGTYPRWNNIKRTIIIIARRPNCVHGLCTTISGHGRYASLWWFMTEPLNIIKTRNKFPDCGELQGLQYAQCSFAKIQ